MERWELGQVGFSLEICGKKLQKTKTTTTTWNDGDGSLISSDSSNTDYYGGSQCSGYEYLQRRARPVADWEKWGDHQQSWP